MKSEAKLQTKILLFLREQGRFVMKTQGGALGTPIGTPDVITIDQQGNFLGLEIKRPDGLGRVSPEQKYNGQKIIDNHGRWYVINNWKEFKEVWYGRV